MNTKTPSKQSESVHNASPSTLKREGKEGFFSFSERSKNTFFGPSVIQPKLEIGQPNDKYEREADRVADTVMRMPGPQVQRQPVEEEEELQKESDGKSTSADQGSDISSQLASKSGTGNRLPKPVRSEMAHKMGADFSGVNIHSDTTAHKLSSQLGARAFTHGSDIYFKKGEYNPDSSKGKHLLAHELTHVLQQNDSTKKKSSELTHANTGGKRIQGGFFADVWEGVKDVGKAIGEGISSGAEAVAGVAGKAWDKATDFLGGAAEWAWEGIKSLSSTVVDWLSTAGRHVWEAIEWFGSKAWEGIKWLGEFLWEKLALIGTNLWSYLSNIPVRLWRVIVHGWEGIKGVINWAWSGLKSAAGYIWDGLVSVFDWLGQGVSGALEWLLNGVESGYQWAVDFIQDPSLSKLFEGLAGALSWAWDGLKGFAKWGWEGIKGAAIWVAKGLKGFGSWLWEGIVSGAKWAGELLLYVLDLVGAMEALQIVWGLIFRMRKLNKQEIEASKKVHPPSMIPYDLIRVDENSIISMIGGAAVTTFHVLHYPKGGLSLDVVVHELTHVAQYENVGSVYMPQAIHAQIKYGRSGSGSAYDYERTGSLSAQRAAGKKYKDLNRESQAQLVQDFYLCKVNNSSTYLTACADFIPYIQDMERGEF